MKEKFKDGELRFAKVPRCEERKLMFYREGAAWPWTVIPDGFSIDTEHLSDLSPPVEIIDPGAEVKPASV